MRTKHVSRWVTGGIAGCPGTVDVSPTGDSPAAAPTPRVPVTSAAHPRTGVGLHRNGWITAAAVVLLVEGGLGILYLPSLVGGDLGPLQPVGMLIGGVSALSIAAGFGLLRLYGWARLAAGALAAIALVFMYAPALAVAVSHGAWLDFAWLGIVAYLVVLFAVVRRWPAEEKR